MKKILKQTTILIILLFVLVLPYFVFAQDGNPAIDRLKNVGPASGYAEATPYTFSKILGIIVSAFLSLLGIVFIAIILQAGYNWMYAGGDEDKLTRAKKQIQRAIIGLIILLSSYAFWIYIYDNFINVAGV